MYYKLINNNLCNRSYQFEPHIVNILNEPFDPRSFCSKGGFYFCDLADMGYWLYLYPNGLIFEVTIPEDARTVRLHRKYKTDKIIISNPLNISDFIKKHNVAESYIRADIKNFQYVDRADYKLCKIAVETDSNVLAIIPVELRTEEICMIAVKNSGNTLKFVIQQTDAICIAAVEQNGNALFYVKNQTPEICIRAVKNDGYALSHVKIQTPELCLAAVKSNFNAISCVNLNLLTQEMCNEAIKQNERIREYLLDVLKFNNSQIILI